MSNKLRTSGALVRLTMHEKEKQSLISDKKEKFLLEGNDILEWLPRNWKVFTFLKLIFSKNIEGIPIDSTHGYTPSTPSLTALVPRVLALTEDRHNSAGYSCLC